MLKELTATEHKILEAVRSNRYDEVTVEMKNGSIFRIAKTNSKNHSNYEELERALMNTRYGEFHLRVENGNIVFSEIVESERA